LAFYKIDGRQWQMFIKNGKKEQGNPFMKTGRNEPCPCGSGKKYKKCCLTRDDDVAFLGRNDLQTGTLLDEYHILFKSVAFYGQALREVNDNKAEQEELESAYTDFERAFKPGTPEGVSDGMFLSWFYFDLRFGADSKTIIERYINEGFTDQLVDPGPMIIEDMAMSYLAFYEIVSVNEEKIGLKELVTGRLFQMVRIGDTFEEDACIGDLWYFRLVGPDYDEMYGFTAPFMFLPESKEFFEHMVGKQVSIVAKTLSRKPKKSERDMLFALACKHSVPFWTKYFVESGPQETEPRPLTVPGPVLVNTDQETMHFCRVYFKIKNKKSVREGLDAVSGIERDEAGDTWVWLKKTRKKIAAGRVLEGWISFQKGRLVGETNSMARALRLKRLLQKALGEAAEYQEIDALSPQAMPKPSEEETRAFEEEQRHLNSDPKVQELIRGKLHDYYYKSWVLQKIPALDGMTPYQAAKTPEGRRKLAALFDHMEHLNAAAPSGGSEFDFTDLKGKLGVI